MESVLCVITDLQLLVLDMDKTLRGDQHDHHRRQDQILFPAWPPLKRILDFAQSKLPLGMGFLKLGNFLHMFGGEYPSDSVYENPYSGKFKVYGNGLDMENPPCPVYILDLTDNQSEPLRLPSMFGPKLYAIVEEIGGQIYVLSRIRVSRTRPLLEVWNPLTNKWRPLPNPPSFLAGYDFSSYCVCDGKIVCYAMTGFVNRFFLASETWDCVKYLSSSESIAMNVKNVSSDLHSKNVYFQEYNDDGNLVAFMKTEEKGCYSSILEFDRSNTVPNIPGFSTMGFLTLVDTSQHGEYMCGLITYHSHNGHGFGLYIIVFQVTKLKLLPPSRPTLSVTYLRRRFYDFTNIRCGNKELPRIFIQKSVIGRLSVHSALCLSSFFT